MTLVKTKRKGKRKTKRIGSVRMSLLNLSKRTNEQVWAAIRHACSGLKLKQHPNMDLTVTGSPSWGATYYPSGFDGPYPLVVARASSDESKFPIKYEPPDGVRGGYLPELWLDSTECLIAMLAHEFRHAWQKEHNGKKRGKVWGARGKYSNRDSDAYALRKVREYRRCRERLDEYEQKVRAAVEYLLPSTYKSIS